MRTQRALAVGVSEVAHDNNIPIVTFGDVINVHPWITDTIWRTEDTLEDACEYIVNYFL